MGATPSVDDTREADAVVVAAVALAKALRGYASAAAYVGPERSGLIREALERHDAALANLVVVTAIWELGQ